MAYSLGPTISLATLLATRFKLTATLESGLSCHSVLVIANPTCSPFCAAGNNLTVHGQYLQKYNVSAHEFVMQKLMYNLQLLYGILLIGSQGSEHLHEW